MFNLQHYYHILGMLNYLSFEVGGRLRIRQHAYSTLWECYNFDDCFGQNVYVMTITRWDNYLVHVQLLIASTSIHH